MSDLNELVELRARADELGIKVDGRWGLAKLCQVISDAEGAADGLATTADRAAAYPIEDEVEPEVIVAPAAPADDWPKRIAPCAWLDQQGRRYTDLGEAMAGADECRDH